MGDNVTGRLRTRDSANGAVAGMVETAVEVDRGLDFRARLVFVRSGYGGQGAVFGIVVVFESSPMALSPHPVLSDAR